MARIKNIKQVMKGVLAAALGVQRKEDHEKDFESGNLLIYVMAGLIFTALFVISIIFLAQLMAQYASQ